MRKMRLRKTELFANKMTALGLLGLGYLSTLIDGDGTGLVILAMLAIPLFFAKENYIQ